MRLLSIDFIYLLIKSLISLTFYRKNSFKSIIQTELELVVNPRTIPRYPFETQPNYNLWKAKSKVSLKFMLFMLLDIVSFVPALLLFITYYRWRKLHKKTALHMDDLVKSSSGNGNDQQKRE